MQKKDTILEISWGQDGPILELDLEERTISCLLSDREPWQSSLCRPEPDPSFQPYLRLLPTLSLEGCDLPSHRLLTFNLPSSIQRKGFDREMQQVCYYFRYCSNRYAGRWKDWKGFVYRRTPTDSFVFDQWCNFRHFHRRTVAQRPGTGQRGNAPIVL